MEALGRLLILVGVFIIILGLILMFAPRLPLVGRLPGDFSFGDERTRVFIPLGTSILISLLLTIVLNLIAALWRR